MATSVHINPNDPNEISRIGRQIYEESFKNEYESKYNGLYVAIDVSKRSANLGKTSLEALNNARVHNPKGLFHLIRVGHSAAFQVRSLATL